MVFEKPFASSIKKNTRYIFDLIYIHIHYLQIKENGNNGNNGKDGKDGKDN